MSFVDCWQRLARHFRCDMPITLTGRGQLCFSASARLDLEGIVAKYIDPYIADRDSSTWFKILNRRYSQKQGREELFERERNREPVAGWH
jgi:ATP-dependent DNA ligase